MPRLIVSPVANAEIDKIWEYILWQNPMAADGVIVKLYETFEALAENPRMGRIRKELRGEPRSFQISGAPFTIFYRPAQDGVKILRVIHMFRDIDQVY